ncbi:MAG TPA: Ni/Fe hydrogenase subunit alpha [Candidatus Methylomirabilis sp.]|nr:Ni/Fe hydrogenase subunit alpha [Candidatus Methylomirabilis sp.]
MATVNIEVHHVTRVEGHGNIVVNARNGVLEECRLEVVETPRFFEAMLRGRPYTQASHITSRICGICAVGHATTSLRATEHALGVEPSEQTRLLRQLIFHGEMLDSHVLHTYMLVAPDFFGVGSVIPLVKAAPEAVLRALRIKKLAGDLCAAIGGRHTHPIAMTVGGFTHLPSLETLKGLRDRLVDARRDMDATVALFKTLPWPQFERQTEYVALRQPEEYAFIDGTITTTDGGSYPVDEYRKLTNEHLVPHSSAKHTQHTRDAYMVGALARFNLNHAQLHPRAKAAAGELGLKPVCTNPYFNTAAQVVEMVHSVEDAIRLCDELIVRGLRPEPLPAFNGKGGEGVGACEVPRGVLFHQYQIEADGRIGGANCIIPTGQNLANIEADMRVLVPQILDQGEEKVRLALEMLVRAYDPCISCSTHLLDVRFV